MTCERNYLRDRSTTVVRGSRNQRFLDKKKAVEDFFFLPPVFFEKGDSRRVLQTRRVSRNQRFLDKKKEVSDRYALLFSSSRFLLKRESRLLAKRSEKKATVAVFGEHGESRKTFGFSTGLRT